MINATSSTPTTATPTPPTATPQPTTDDMNTMPTSKKPKKKFNFKLIGGVLVIAVLVIGALVGMLLVNQTQDIRQQASMGDIEPSETQICVECCVGQGTDSAHSNTVCSTTETTQDLKDRCGGPVGPCVIYNTDTLVCTPNRLECQGDKQRRCLADGSGWVFTGDDSSCNGSTNPTDPQDANMDTWTCYNISNNCQSVVKTWSCSTQKNLYHSESICLTKLAELNSNCGIEEWGQCIDGMLCNCNASNVCTLEENSECATSNEEKCPGGYSKTKPIEDAEHCNPSTHYVDEIDSEPNGTNTCYACQPKTYGMTSTDCFEPSTCNLKTYYYDGSNQKTCTELNAYPTRETCNESGGSLPLITCFFSDQNCQSKTLPQMYESCSGYPNAYSSQSVCSAYLNGEIDETCYYYNNSNVSSGCYSGSCPNSSRSIPTGVTKYNDLSSCLTAHPEGNEDPCPETGYCAISCGSGYESMSYPGCSSYGTSSKCCPATDCTATNVGSCNTLGEKCLFDLASLSFDWENHPDCGGNQIDDSVNCWSYSTVTKECFEASAKGSCNGITAYDTSDQCKAENNVCDRMGQCVNNKTCVYGYNGKLEAIGASCQVSCGDEICNGSEWYGSCPQDCDTPTNLQTTTCSFELSDSSCKGKQYDSVCLTSDKQKEGFCTSGSSQDNYGRTSCSCTGGGTEGSGCLDDSNCSSGYVCNQTTKTCVVSSGNTGGTGNTGGQTSGLTCPDGQPAAITAKFTCGGDSGPCADFGNGGLECRSGDVIYSTDTKLTLATGECGQIDYYTAKQADGTPDWDTYCGHDGPVCTGCESNNPPVDNTDPDVPDNPPAGPQCLNITMLDAQNQSITSADINDQVKFQCGQVSGVSRYDFRLIYPDGQVVKKLGTESNNPSRVSPVFPVNQSGKYAAQCRVCVTENGQVQCQAFETIPN